MAFRGELLQVVDSSTELGTVEYDRKIEQIIDLCIIAATFDVVDASLPFVLLEDLMDFTPIWNAKKVVDLLEMRSEKLTLVWI